MIGIRLSASIYVIVLGQIPATSLPLGPPRQSDAISPSHESVQTLTERPLLRRDHPHPMVNKLNPVQENISMHMERDAEQNTISILELEKATRVHVQTHAERSMTTTPSGSKQLLNVAVLITGLVRCFKYQMVAESMKTNLLDVLAESKNTVDTFLRLSLQDHVSNRDYRRPPSTGQDAIIEETNDAGVVSQINANINLLNPVQVVWYLAGSPEEQVEEQNFFPSMQHRAARLAHPRLYHQVFNRYMNYKSAKAYERRTGRLYHWFISLRPDLLLYAPMPSLAVLSANKIWVTNHWNWKLPDVLLYVPATKVNATFDIEVLAEPQHCCFSDQSIWSLPDPSSELAKHPSELQQAVLKGKCPGESSSCFARELPVCCTGGEAFLDAATKKHKVQSDIAFYPLALTIGHLMDPSRIQDECFRVSLYLTGWHEHFTFSVAEQVSCREMLWHHSACIQRSDKACPSPQRPNGKHGFAPFAVKNSKRECLRSNGKGIETEACARIYYKKDESNADSLGVDSVARQSFFPIYAGNNAWQIKFARDDLCLLHSSPEAMICDKTDRAQLWSLNPITSNEGEAYSLSDTDAVSEDVHLTLVAIPTTPKCSSDKSELPCLT